jgi:demethylmenaquinone methyltransferase/2-methoxy-6-polyprenyl-1,4-benzoquinol methylase
MTVRTESRVTIAGSVTEVWAYVNDVERWPEWAPTVLESWVRGGAPLRPGSRVEQRAKGLFWSARVRSQQVTAVQAPRRVTFAGPMGTSAARWGMVLEPMGDGQTDAEMWIEVDLAGIMRASPCRILEGRIQRVSNREMAAIKAAVESATPRGPNSSMRAATSDPVASETDKPLPSPADRARERLIGTYRKSAKRYDVTSRLYPVPGYPQRAHRLRAVQALRLRPGDSVVEIACGTGLNFPLIEQEVGPEGRIVGVDISDSMLARAEHRIQTNGWSNISLVQADSAEFEFPTGIDAILATYAHSLLPDPGHVIARGAAALSAGGRWVVLDLKIPDGTPRWLTRLGIAIVGRATALEEWTMRRPWESIQVTMQDTLTDLSWTDLILGTAYLAVGSRSPLADHQQPQGGGHE